MPVPKPIEQAQVQETAKSVANKALNGAQTQSLIMVIQQYQSKDLTLQQAVNIIALSIVISKDDAKELIGETMLQSGGEDDTLEEREQHIQMQVKMTIQKLFFDAKYIYDVTHDGYGGIIINSKIKIK